MTALLPILFSLCGCVPLCYHCYEGAFGGLRMRMDEAASTNAAMQMVLIHGMGNHCPGYGDTFANNLAKKLDLSRQSDSISIPLPSSTGATNWLREFSYSSGKRRLSVYELTWTPTTFPIKTNAFAKDRKLDPRRVLINQALKRQVMEDGFGDAILYLNPVFQSKMQDPIRQTINYVESRAATNDRIVLVASSLGSKMTFDTVEKWASQDRGVQHFAGRTTDILMLANQLPLLHLARGTNELLHARETSLKAFLRISRDQRKLQPQPRELPETNRFTINVVAATDPNDLLSWPLRAEDVVPDDRDEQNKVAISVSNLYAHNAWVIPFLFENPGPAHEQYAQNNWLMKKFVRGFSRGKECFRRNVPEALSCNQRSKKNR